MSGHADDALVDHGVPAGTLSFLEKPFTREELLTKVRESLEPGT
jgi:FixJ family two-component response regulator